MSFKGNLKSFSLAEIFQSLNLNNHTGTLRICIKPDDPESTRFIHFGKGAITFVSPSSPKGFKIGEILFRKGIVSEECIKEALKLQHETGDRLGKILINQGLVSKEAITNALTDQLREEIYDLFMLEKAEFEFQINAPPPYHKDPLQKIVKIEIDPQPLIIEGVRRLDEWEIIRTSIQTFDEIFTPTGLQPENLDENESEVFHLLDGRTPVHELFTKLSFGRFLCARALFNLTTSGLIRSLTFEELIELSEDSNEDIDKTPFIRFALQLHPSDTKLRIKLAESYIEDENIEEAEKITQKGIAIEPDEKDLKELSELFIKISPNNPEALKIAIANSLNQNQLEKAVEYSISLSDILNRNNKTEEATETLTAIEAHISETPDLRLLLANKWRQLGTLEKSIPHLEFLADHYEEAEEWTKLNKVLRWILDADPNRQDARYRLDQITITLKAKDKKRFRWKVALIMIAVIIGFSVATPLIYQSRANIAFASLKIDQIKSYRVKHQSPEESDQEYLYALKKEIDSFSNKEADVNEFKMVYPWSPLVGEADVAIKR